MKNSYNLSMHLGIGIACFLVGVFQIYSGLEPLDYIPIMIIGFSVIYAGYDAKKKNESK